MNNPLLNPEKPAVFLDRDGVLIHNRANYVRTWSEVKIYPYTFEAIKTLNQAGFFVFIITNQSPIGRGILSEDQVQQINQKLQDTIAAHGGQINKIYFCPHTPQMNCTCRKPNPGMIQQAFQEYSINQEQSWLVGDAISDIQAGINGGLTHNIMLLTGRGKKQLKNKPQDLLCLIEKNLKTAVQTILKNK